VKVAIEASPIKTQHSIRGIGNYTRNLIESLKKLESDLTLEEFYDPKNPPKADIIHYPYFDLFFHTLPKNSNAKRVITIHDVIPLVFPDKFPSGIRGKINLILQKKALKNTSAVICDSKTSKSDIIKKLSYAQNKTHVVYLAQAQSFREIQKKEALKKVRENHSLPEKFILYVGDINWNKNLPNLLKAVQIIGVNLVCVGASLVDQNLVQTKSLTDQIKDLGIEKTVKRLGFVKEEDLVSIYNLATATILPSFYEGFGLPIVESMACGTPIICSNNSSLIEIAGKAAIYCDPENPEDIAQKISQTLKLNKADLSKKLVAQASKFSWEKVALETLQVYKQIL